MVCRSGSGPFGLNQLSLSPPVRFDSRMRPAPAFVGDGFCSLCGSSWIKEELESCSETEPDRAEQEVCCADAACQTTAGIHWIVARGWTLHCEASTQTDHAHSDASTQTTQTVATRETQTPPTRETQPREQTWSTTQCDRSRSRRPTANTYPTPPAPIRIDTQLPSPTATPIAAQLLATLDLSCDTGQ